MHVVHSLFRGEGFQEFSIHDSEVLDNSMRVFKSFQGLIKINMH